MLKRLLFFVFTFSILLLSCKTKETIEVSVNKPKNYDDISTVKVENYINRIYIDLLGRGATEIVGDGDRKGISAVGVGVRFRAMVMVRVHVTCCFAPNK